MIKLIRWLIGLCQHQWKYGEPMPCGEHQCRWRSIAICELCHTEKSEEYDVPHKWSKWEEEVWPGTDGLTVQMRRCSVCGLREHKRIQA